jgi:alpha-D-ribose 1-methylphosphonate 5-triphosphate synthase subunit PhnI
MAYVATKGGEAAIQQAERLYHQMKGRVTQGAVQTVLETMPYLVDRVMGEGSLYAPELAALALVQSGGDLYEAVLLLRAYRSTQPRLAYAAPVTPARTLTVRRISAAFKDIPGGQVLGPTLDYSHRVLRLGVLDGADDPIDPVDPAAVPAPKHYPAVADWLRQNGMLADDEPHTNPDNPADIPDITRDSVSMPAPRAHRLQALARSETGGTLTLGYAGMRGYGFTHPTVNDLRLGYAEVEIQHPITGEPFSVGRVRTSQAEVVTRSSDGYEIGFAATLGWNEVKLIAGATLDMEMNQPEPHPAHSEDFVLHHTETVEASGFCIHFKLPHYVTFSSDMDALRKVMQAQYPGMKTDTQNAQPEAKEDVTP